MLKKLLFLLFIPILFSACRTVSPIVTTKKSTTVTKTKPISVVKSTPPQKKVRIEEQVIQEKPITKEKTPDIPLDNDDEFAVKPSNSNTLKVEIADDIIQSLGVRYKTGGISKTGFDCSGLLYASFLKYDVKVPRTALEMSRFTVKIDPKDAEKGDLIFFKTLGSGQINHVGMVVEVNDDEIKFIHASIKKGVIISTTKEGYYKTAFAQVNRILD